MLARSHRCIACVEVVSILSKVTEDKATIKQGVPKIQKAMMDGVYEMPQELHVVGYRLFDGQPPRLVASP